MITIQAPMLGEVEVHDDGRVFCDQGKVETSLAELCFIIQEAQSADIRIKVAISATMWHRVRAAG